MPDILEKLATAFNRFPIAFLFLAWVALLTLFNSPRFFPYLATNPDWPHWEMYFIIACACFWSAGAARLAESLDWPAPAALAFQLPPLLLPAAWDYFIEFEIHELIMFAAGLALFSHLAPYLPPAKGPASC